MKFKILTLIPIITGSLAYAQSDTTFFAGVRELQKVFDESNYKPIAFNDTSLAVLENISKRKRNTQTIDRSLYLQKQKELLERDYSLAITGGYLENINPTIGDLEDNIIYNRRFVTGVEWKILDNGYLENRVKARILEDKIQRTQLIHDAEQESFHYLERFDYTIFIFNKVKIQLLDKRKIQLEKQYDVIHKLVLLKKLKKEEIINLQTRLAEVESLIKVYQSYNDYLGITDDSVSFSIDNLPLIDLNYSRIFELIGTQTDSLLASDIYQDYYSWYHQIGLGTFVRYNYYDLIGPNNRAFFSAGVNFSIPIPFNHKLQNEVEAERWKYENEKFVKTRIDLHEDVLNTGYEFRYKLKQFVGFYQKRKLFIERLRVEKVKVRLGDANVDPLGGLDLYDDLLQIDIELVDLLQNMYLKAVKIHSRIPYSKIREIVTVQTSKNLSSYLDKKERAVYIWSKTFEDYSPEFLTEYCIYNEFKKIVVAVNEKDSLKKEKELFMNYAQENAELYFMIGNNNLMFKKDVAGELTKILNNYTSIKPKGIHLDIEPHTFENWQTEKQTLTNLYLEFVGKASTFCKDKNLELAVSIPPHYNPEVVDNLLGMVDEIYFMCYENIKTDYLVNRLVTYTDNSLDKIVVAFRTEDFVNRIEMEQKIKEIELKTGITQFAYHDLRRIISFDRKSIE